MPVDIDKLTNYYAEGGHGVALSDIDLKRVPRHVSIIMDGNGRWATARGLDRSKGHVAGVDALREAVTTSVRLGVEVFSVYAFSTDELPLFHQENVRLLFFGDLTRLPERTRKVFQRGLDETADHTGMVFALAVNYGSRAEIARAARELAEEVAAGTLSPDDIDEDALSSRLYTAGLPDPDLLIRTSGEMRLSNYLLWQLAYTEFYVTNTLWPDFSRWDYLKAIASYQARSRRFGGVVSR